MSTHHRLRCTRQPCLSANSPCSRALFHLTFHHNPVMVMVPLSPFLSGPRATMNTTHSAWGPQSRLASVDTAVTAASESWQSGGSISVPEVNIKYSFTGRNGLFQSLEATAHRCSLAHRPAAQSRKPVCLFPSSLKLLMRLQTSRDTKHGSELE